MINIIKMNHTRKKLIKKSSDEPVIIIKNKPIQNKEKKEKKEPPMLLVKKDVLYCDTLANGTDDLCVFEAIEEGGLGPDSDRWVQDCTATNEFEILCDNFNEDSFNMIVTDDVKFPSSKSTKLNLNGERYMVTEEDIDTDFGFDSFIISLACQESGFDDHNIISLRVDEFFVGSCVQFEGECSGIVHDGELNECTVKNHVIAIFVE